MNRKTKIIATLGPSSDSPEGIRDLVQAGVDIFRLNFSHGDLDQHRRIIQQIRAYEDEIDRPITILQDLRGVKIRTGVLGEGQKISLEQGDLVTIVASGGKAGSGAISVDYAPLPQVIKAGQSILLDDGKIELFVQSVDSDRISARVEIGGILGSRKGVNLPGVELAGPALTDKDIADLKFGLELGVDAVAMSFVQRSQDIVDLRQMMRKILPDRDAQIPIIAKLERTMAVNNLHAILAVSDGVMVARGDLGVEASPERVPSIQKEIIRQANAELKLVITATQMLESMIDSPKPTRAEASDVANAVFDGSDMLMLSGETAIGKYPVQAVNAMVEIIQDAESHAAEWGRLSEYPLAGTYDDAVAVTHAASTLARDRNVAAITVFTFSGRTAHLMSKVRPEMPVLALTPELSTYRRLGMLWGVIPKLVPVVHSVEGMIDRVRSVCRDSENVQLGEQVVIIASFPVGSMNPPNFAMIHTVEA
jgi:pyruvate kinase